MSYDVLWVKLKYRFFWQWPGPSCKKWSMNLQPNGTKMSRSLRLPGIYAVRSMEVRGAYGIWSFLWASHSPNCWIVSRDGASTYLPIAIDVLHTLETASTRWSLSHSSGRLQKPSWKRWWTFAAYPYHATKLVFRRWRWTSPVAATSLRPSSQK